jgi:hypothetical protein
MTTYDGDLRALGERVRKLEIQNHRWKLGTLLLALVFASSLTMTMGPWHASKPSVLRPKTVETQDLELKSSSGQVRARLTVRNDQASFELYSDTGKVIWKAPGPLMVGAGATGAR